MILEGIFDPLEHSENDLLLIGVGKWGGDYKVKSRIFINKVKIQVINQLSYYIPPKMTLF